MPTSGEPHALSLVHLTRAPRAAPAEGRPPLLALLHGVGSNERDLFSLADALDPRLRVISLRAPLVRGPGSFAWFDVEFRPEGNIINPDQLRASRDAIARVMAEAVAAYGADGQRVYLAGFSQGAIMSLALGLTQPALVAGLAPMSGRIPPEVRPEIAAPADLAGLPVLLVHGRADAVIPIRYAREAQALLQALPVALTYREYDMGHEINPDAYRELLGWITARLDGPRREVRA
jgi:phospholipase/carboxylesterase